MLVLYSNMTLYPTILLYSNMILYPTILLYLNIILYSNVFLYSDVIFKVTLRFAIPMFILLDMNYCTYR